MRAPLAVPVGDPAGVGPVVSLTAAASLAPTVGTVLFGDAALLRRLANEHVPELALETLTGLERPLGPGRVGLCDTGSVPPEVVRAHAPTAAGGAAQWQALCRATDAVRAGHARALVTAPVSKAAIVAAGQSFIGQTEFLARSAGLVDDEVTMMFLGPVLNVALVTTHLSVRDVPGAITVERVVRACAHLTHALQRLVSTRPLRIAVSGLNPHAGEGGLFGDEDERVIAPAVERARAQLGNVAALDGPVPAEAVFRAAQAQRLHGVVAMYHDQATIASKLLDWGQAVNVTWGLPFVRTSVDHGVAYDAARDGIATDDGMRAALLLAHRLTAGDA